MQLLLEKTTVLLHPFADYLVLPCTVLIFLIGFYLGRARIKEERQMVLKALTGMLKSADQLSQDVNNHNTELADIEETVEELDVSIEVRQVQNTLLTHISGVIASNKRLEDDLTCARYELMRQSQELDRTRREARTDELSQVGNRKSYDETLQYRLSKWNRRGKAFALVICDIDHFKWINDTHGHRAGDYVVMGVGSILKKHMGNKHFVARYGGDEFVFLLMSKNRQSTIELAQELVSAIGNHDFSVAGSSERVAVTFSTGMAFVRKGDTAESLFRRGDAKLYEAKRAGRNCLRVDDEVPKAAQQLVGNVVGRIH